MVSAARVQDHDPPTSEPGSEGVRSRLGFRDGDRGTHSSRTLMLRELELLLDATPAGAGVADLRRVIPSSG